MHVHGMCGMQMSKSTSLARPQRGAKSPATVTADAAVRSRTPAVKPLPSAAKAVSVGPPARVRSGRLGCPRLPGSRAPYTLRRRKRNPYACRSAVS